MVLMYYSYTVISYVLTGQASEIFNVDTQFKINTLILEIPFWDYVGKYKMVYLW